MDQQEQQAQIDKNIKRMEDLIEQFSNLKEEITTDITSNILKEILPKLEKHVKKMSKKIITKKTIGNIEEQIDAELERIGTTTWEYNEEVISGIVRKDNIDWAILDAHTGGRIAGKAHIVLEILQKIKPGVNPKEFWISFVALPGFLPWEDEVNRKDIYMSQEYADFENEIEVNYEEGEDEEDDEYIDNGEDSEDTEEI